MGSYGQKFGSKMYKKWDSSWSWNSWVRVLPVCLFWIWPRILAAVRDSCSEHISDPKKPNGKFMNSTPPFWDLSRESWDARSEPLPRNKVESTYGTYMYHVHVCMHSMYAYMYMTSWSMEHGVKKNMNTSCWSTCSTTTTVRKLGAGWPVMGVCHDIYLCIVRYIMYSVLSLVTCSCRSVSALPCLLLAAGGMEGAYIHDSHDMTCMMHIDRHQSPIYLLSYSSSSKSSSNSAV